jgi:hypothetical protein
MIIPLPYSVPSELLTTDKEMSQQKKEFLIAPMIPAKGETYVYNTRKAYLDMYKKSVFAFTFQKGGWDCLRHYEILACGCVPLFVGIEKCPPRTLKGFPKRAAKEVLEKAGDKEIELEEYKQLRKVFFDYVKHKGTCRASAQHLLNRLTLINKGQKASSVLIYNRGGGNYSREMLTIGLRKLLGAKCVDYPRNQYIYGNLKMERIMLNLHGIVDDNGVCRDNIEQRIAAKEFTYIIITGCEHVGYNFWQDRLWPKIQGSYDAKHILFLFGGDMPTILNNANCILRRNVRNHEKHGICLVRELDDSSTTVPAQNYHADYQPRMHNNTQNLLSRAMELKPRIEETQKNLLSKINE